MCFVRWCRTGFSTRDIEDCLSQCIVTGILSFNYWKSCVYQEDCATVEERAIYSASVVDLATDFCFLVDQAIVQFLSLKVYLENEHQSSKLLQ